MTAQSTIRTCLLLAAVTIGLARAHAQEIDTVALRQDTRFLSHDSLMGRGTGTHGERVAARYISERCEAIGLRPMGNHWEHTFNLFESSYPDPPEIAVGDIKMNSEVMVDLVPFDGDLEGRMAGFASLDVALPSLPGYIVFMPAPAQPRTLADSLRARGAVALVLLARTPEMYAQYQAVQGQTRLSLDPPDSDFPVLVVGPSEVGEDICRNSLWTHPRPESAPGLKLLLSSLVASFAFSPAAKVTSSSP